MFPKDPRLEKQIMSILPIVGVAGKFIITPAPPAVEVDDDCIKYAVAALTFGTLIKKQPKTQIVIKHTVAIL